MEPFNIYKTEERATDVPEAKFEPKEPKVEPKESEPEPKKVEKAKEIDQVEISKEPEQVEELEQPEIQSTPQYTSEEQEVIRDYNKRNLEIKERIPGDMLEKQGALEEVERYLPYLSEIERNNGSHANLYWRMIGKLTATTNMSEKEANDVLTETLDNYRGRSKDLTKIPGSVSTEDPTNIRQDSPWPDLIL